MYGRRKSIHRSVPSYSNVKLHALDLRRSYRSRHMAHIYLWNIFILSYVSLRPLTRGPVQRHVMIFQDLSAGLDKYEHWSRGGELQLSSLVLC